MNFDELIRNVPDFPKPGVLFKDITPLLKNPHVLRQALTTIADQHNAEDFDLIVGMESRGFIFGMGLSMLLGKGFVPIRKPGKLPAKIYCESYDLEYGRDTLEIHQDAIVPGQKVLLIDDLLATGGTMAASIKLVNRCQAKIVGCAFVIELEFLNGRAKLAPQNVTSLIKY